MKTIRALGLVAVLAFGSAVGAFAQGKRPADVAKEADVAKDVRPETSAARATAIGDGLVSSVLPVSLACWVGIGMVPTAAAPTANKSPEKSHIFRRNPLQIYRSRPPSTCGGRSSFPVRNFRPLSRAFRRVS